MLSPTTIRSDQFHYIHHQKFECNYSAAQPVNFDGHFDHFVPSLRPKHSSPDTPQDPPKVAVAGLAESNPTARLGVPKPPAFLFNCLAGVIFGVVYWGVFANVGAPRVTHIFHIFPVEMVVAAVGAVGPIAACFAVRATTKDSQPWSWPFHNESSWKFGVHIAGAVVSCVIPLWVFLFLAAAA